jgi:group I intron endonuclease
MVDTWILYRTTNLVNSKIYVGVHKVADTARSKKYLGSGDQIRSAIKKYGRENFIRETLAEFSSCTDVYDAEAKLVNQEFVSRDDTYNICLGGRGGVNLTEDMKNKLRIANTGKKASPETRLKMSESRKGRTLSKEHIEKLISVHIGKKRSPETRSKISAAAKGRVVSEEVRAKIGAASKGNKNRLGSVASLETRAKMSASQKGNKNSLGCTVSQETKNKIAEIHSVAVVINGKYYTSFKKASIFEGITYKAVRYRLKSLDPKWSEWRKATDAEKLSHLSEL